jgi:tight adherence protein C
MPLYVILAAVAVMAAIPLFIYALVGDRLSEDRVGRNLREGLGAATDLRKLVLSQSANERVLQPTLKFLARRARRVSPAGVISHLERRLVLAGSSIPVDLILIAKLVLGGFLAMVGAIAVLRWPSLRMVLAALLVAIVGYIFPDVVLARRVHTRQLAIRNELPDLLDQITICVEAGLGFDAALARTTRLANTPLSLEITRMHQELRIGVPRREALENLLARTDVAELRQFAHALVQAEAYGVPVSQMLRAQAAENREKRKHAAEERAMKLPVKITFPLVFCILPAMFIVILGPAAIRFMQTY